MYNHFTCPTCSGQISAVSLVGHLPSPTIPVGRLDGPLRSTVEAALEHLPELEDKATSLQDLLDAVDAAVSDLKILRLRLKEPENFSQGLPTDVLRSVFKHASADEELPTASQPTLYRLAAVSRTWRDAVLRTPSLWSNIRFAVRRKVTDADLMLIQDWLAHSNDCALDISISVELRRPSDCSATAMEGMERLLRIVHRHASQWKVVALCFPSKAFGDYCPILSTFGRFPRLTALTLDIIPIESSAMPSSRELISSSNAPHLRNLTLSNIPAQSLSENLLPWDQIRELSCDYNHPSMPAPIRRLLQLAPNVEKMKVNSSDTALGQHDLEGPQLILRSLQQLEVSNGSVLFLKVINAPSLEKLSIDGCLRDNIDEGTDAVRRLVTMSTGLKSLSIDSRIFRTALVGWTSSRLESLSIIPELTPLYAAQQLEYLQYATLSSSFPSLKVLAIISTSCRGEGYELLDIGRALLTLCRFREREREADRWLVRLSFRLECSKEVVVRRGLRDLRIKALYDFSDFFVVEL